MSKRNNIDDKNKFQNKEESSNSNGDFLKKTEIGGLKYIKKERSYLKMSALFPIYSLTIIIINIIFILIGVILFRSGLIDPVPEPDFDFTFEQKIALFFHITIPSGIFFIISIFTLIQFIFLKKWNSKILEYDKVKDLKGLMEIQVLSEDIPTKDNITLTNLFYDIVIHMERIRVIFILINIFSFFYLYWSFRFFVYIVAFLIDRDLIAIFPMVLYLNFSGAIVLIFYLILMWYHYRRWHKKLKLLKKFEKKIVEELDL